MWIGLTRITLKPGTDDEMLRIFNEIGFPVFREIPGCISVNILKYLPEGTSKPQWDYAIVQVWESEEARQKAARDKLIGNGSQLYEKGFYEKLKAITEVIHVIGVPVANF